MKKEFTNTEIDKIVQLYCVEGLNTTEVAIRLGVSKTPILRVLKDKGLLRVGKSNGVKIILTTEQEMLIKEMYLREYMSCDEIAKKTRLTAPFIDKYLSKCKFRRDKGSAASIGLVKRYRDMNYDDYLNIIDEYYKYELKVLKITRQQSIKKLT